jgi:hypothetical protein
MTRVPARGAHPNTPRKRTAPKRPRKPERDAKVTIGFTRDELELLLAAANVEHESSVSYWGRRHLLLLARRLKERGHLACPLEGGEWIRLSYAEEAVRVAFEDPTILERFRRALGPKQRPSKRRGETAEA